MADFLLRFFLAEDMRAAVQEDALDIKTYAAVVAQRTIYVILDLNNMQEEPQWRITAPSGARPPDSGLTDLIVVVTRYFGGVLLGTGGLVRAYTTATARALENAEVVTVRSVVELSVTVDYSLYERASLLIDAAGAKQAAPQFTDRVTLCWQMPEHTEGPLLEQLRELTRGGAQVTVSDPFYAPF